MSLTKIFGSTLIAMIVFKFCFYVDFVNFHIKILSKIIEKNFKAKNLSENEKVRKFNKIRLCYICVLKMARCLSESVTFTLPLVVAVVIICLVRRAYRFYALFTGQLPFEAFMTTLLNNTTEELAYMIALCYCCNKTEIVVRFWEIFIFYLSQVT
jgi:hypothetical protein